MEEKKAKELIERIGMSHDLESLLHEPESYKRFEKSVERALSESLNRKSWVINIEKGRKGMEYHTYPEAVELFREYFGVGRTPETSLGLYSIAKNMLKKYFGFGKKNVTMTTMAKKHKVSRALISQKIDFVSILLKQKYARDIWYDSI